MQLQFHSCAKQQGEKSNSWPLVNYSICPSFLTRSMPQTIAWVLTLSRRVSIISSQVAFFFSLLTPLLTKNIFSHETWANIYNNQCRVSCKKLGLATRSTLAYKIFLDKKGEKTTLFCRSCDFIVLNVAVFSQNAPHLQSNACSDDGKFF